MRSACFCIGSVLLSIAAHAGVSVESGCYQQAFGPVGKNSSFFLFQSYRDEDLREDVGAFVSYRNSSQRIALLFVEEVQGEGAGEGEFQKTWLEVIDRRVTGQYVEFGNANGNPGGKHIKYTNFKARRVTTFGLATVGSPCLMRSR